MADFFVMREAIKARVQEALPEIKRIYFAEDLDGVKLNSQNAPAVHILYGGYQPAQAERAREAIRISQTWTVVLAVRNARNEYGAGETLDKLIAALHGFKPEDARHALALQLAAPSFAPSYRPGVAFYPLAFQTEVINQKGALTNGT